MYYHLCETTDSSSEMWAFNNLSHARWDDKNLSQRPENTTEFARCFSTLKFEIPENDLVQIQTVFFIQFSDFIDASMWKNIKDGKRNKTMLHSFSSRTGCTASAATEESDVAPASGAAPSTWTQQISKRGPSDTSVFKRVKFLILTHDSIPGRASQLAARSDAWLGRFYFFSSVAELKHLCDLLLESCYDFIVLNTSWTTSSKSGARIVSD